MEKPLVSICCITYNHGKYIADCLDGFIKQKTKFPFEILVFDDASTDNAQEIIKKYSSGLENMQTFLQEENQWSKGEYGLLKYLFPAAKGRYIAVCEGDDYWTDPLKLQKQVDFLEKNTEYSMVCHDALIIDETDNSSKLYFASPKKRQICSTKDALNIQFCPTASILFRSEAILPLSNFDLMPEGGDQVLVQLISLNGLLYRMYDVMSVYRKTAIGASEVNKKNLKESLEKRINSLKNLNEISNHTNQKYIRIENLLIQNRIDLLGSKSELKTLILKMFRKILTVIKGII